MGVKSISGEEVGVLTHHQIGFIVSEWGVEPISKEANLVRLRVRGIPTVELHLQRKIASELVEGNCQWFVYPWVRRGEPVS